MDYIDIIRADFKKYEEKEKNGRIVAFLPIESVCGLTDIGVEIHQDTPPYHTDLKYWINIMVYYHDHSHMEDDYPDHTTKNLHHFRAKTLEEVLTHFDDLSENSYLDKSSHIIKGNQEEESVIKLNYKKFYEKHKNSRCVKLNYGECCVCYEHTHNKTSCKHHICLKCYQKIEPVIEKWNIEDENDDDDDNGESDYGRIVCPMCRQKCDFRF